jgi:hypothetical protein
MDQDTSASLHRGPPLPQALMQSTGALIAAALSECHGLVSMLAEYTPSDKSVDCQHFNKTLPALEHIVQQYRSHKRIHMFHKNREISILTMKKKQQG